MATDAKDLVFTDNGDAVNMKNTECGNCGRINVQEACKQPRIAVHRW